MTSTLVSILKQDETLLEPFYGCLMQRGLSLVNYFGFFGRTNSHLLIAILNPFNAKKIDWFTRIPLDIKRVKIHKSLFSKQYIIKIVFNKGNPCKIRVSKKVFGGDFVHQEQNVSSFIEFLTQYTK